MTAPVSAPSLNVAHRKQFDRCPRRLQQWCSSRAPGIRPVGSEILTVGKGYEVGLDLIVQSAQSTLKAPAILGKERQDSAFIGVEAPKPPSGSRASIK
ncbi:hypothetical protein ACH40F_53420 [Streptomyces sp. NPDC020794]|uniref:hypothetical protein n=1 Tax=unclassified Streptomyces TaxID=2593676 RepID=UPI0036DFD9AF